MTRLSPPKAREAQTVLALFSTYAAIPEKSQTSSSLALKNGTFPKNFTFLTQSRYNVSLESKWTVFCNMTLDPWSLQGPV